ncbi:SPOR domain-containing protein [Terriglobus sp. RCC_193]|uniref:SPOR domain-containing protein n=1 Tax=Terriglobus sp. RCC_193 TaxID=3239218 RepID=UPI003526A32B
MSYDFSFQKSQMWLLGLLATLMSVLLVTAGFLMGRISVTPSASTTAAAPVVQSTQPAVKVSASPALTAPVVRVPGATMTLAAPTTAVSAAPAESTQDVVQLTSPAADSGTVAINAASSSGSAGGDVYQLAATGYALQYGAFRDPANARDLMKQLKDAKIVATIMTMRNAYGESYSVVRSGAYPTVADARQAAVDQANLLKMPIVVRPAARL